MPKVTWVAQGEGRPWEMVRSSQVVQHPMAHCLPLPSAHRSWHPRDRKQLLYLAPHPADNGEPAILCTSRGMHGTHVRRGWAELRQVRGVVTAERNTIDSPTD